MNSSESAEVIVKLSLDGMEVALKIAGAGAKNIAVMLYTIMKDKQQTKGKIRLKNMLKTGKSLKIFSIRAEDIKKFSQEAKKYGIRYCALADKKNSKIDGIVDIMVLEEDASKINRIAERFNFKDITTIEKEIEQNKTESKEEMPSNNKPKQAEKNQSENFLNIKPEDKIKISDKKKSVKKELKDIEEELKIGQNRKSKQLNNIGKDKITKNKKRKKNKDER